jgi:hypothetical protein
VQRVRITKNADALQPKWLQGTAVKPTYLMYTIFDCLLFQLTFNGSCCPRKK